MHPKSGCDGATTFWNRVPPIRTLNIHTYVRIIFGCICKGSFLESQLEIFSCIINVCRGSCRYASYQFSTECVPFSRSDETQYDNEFKFHLNTSTVFRFTEGKTCRFCIYAARRILGRLARKVLRTASVAIKVKAAAKENQVEMHEARIHVAHRYRRWNATIQRHPRRRRPAWSSIDRTATDRQVNRSSKNKDRFIASYFFRESRTYNVVSQNSPLLRRCKISRSKVSQFF